MRRTADYRAAEDVDDPFCNRRAGGGLLYYCEFCRGDCVSPGECGAWYLKQKRLDRDKAPTGDRFRRISEALGPKRPQWQVTRKRRSPPKPWHERAGDRLLYVLDHSFWMLVCAGGMLLLAAVLAGCAGAANDIATRVNAQGSAALENTIARRAEQNDLQIRAAESYYCAAVSTGAVARRYRDPAVRTLYEQLCGVVEALP